MKAVVKKSLYQESKDREIKLQHDLQRVIAELEAMKITMEPSLRILEDLQNKLKKAEVIITELTQKNDSLRKKLDETFPILTEPVNDAFAGQFNETEGRSKKKRKKE